MVQRKTDKVFCILEFFCIIILCRYSINIFRVQTQAQATEPLNIPPGSSIDAVLTDAPDDLTRYVFVSISGFTCADYVKRQRLIRSLMLQEILIVLCQF